MGYKIKSLMIGLWQKIKILIILAIIAAVGYGGWIGWKKFIKKAQRSTSQGGAKRAAAIERKSK